MKKIIAALFIFTFSNSFAQTNPGDTIKITAFKYGSSSRDTAINFPSGNTTYDKILMKYNMRCKNGLISSQAQPNQGCGEWDYSCNTFVVDSTRIENDLNYAPNYLISNFSGSVFPYSNAPLFDYYNFVQNNVVLNNIVSENQFTLGAGSSTLANFLPANQHSARSQALFTAAELTAAGFSAGNIDGLLLNVANAGASTNFFKVSIKHSTLTVLNNSTVSVTGFTNVFNSNKTFTTGVNRLQFYTPFVWDGTSNIIVDFFFTNTVPSNPLIFTASSTPSVQLISARNNYALDLVNNGRVTINPSMFGGINNEITVAFWAYGNSSYMPANTTFMYAWATDQNQRHFNLHLPWGDSNIYFDCGFGGGSYDRINKAANPADIGGQWNHWAFTKNTVSGNMKIYLNGTLWHSGAAETKTMSILNMLLGNDPSLGTNYKGKLNELSVWNKELSASDIQNWMIKPLDNTHPFYSNLQAYYPMSEGTGSVVAELKYALSSSGNNMQWTYDRGNKLNRSFTEYTLRPNVVFLRGTYSLTTNTVTVKDSVVRNPNVVDQYSVISNATVVPMAHDALTLTSTQYLYSCDPIKTYDGDTETLTGTTACVPQATLNIIQMPYYKRYPFYNELVSFVTPYGKGLDLGINGKTWYFDATDFAPLLKNKKRLVMTLGGQYQEQMDIDFLFIIGTPPRTVMNFNQLWQGAGRAGDAAVSTITADVRFNTQTVVANAGAQTFKLRSTITGHGSQGEFGQNGGVMTHFFNVDGGNSEYFWTITQLCGYNPMMAQGGTWVYPRQGWCPGQASLTREFDLTPYLVPGNTHTLDYTISNPAVNGGDYRYIEAHQLVSYGTANHSADAAIVDVMKPSNKFLYSKTNPICQRPSIMVQNTGSNSISSIEFEYWVNNAQSKQTYTWTGSKNYLDTINVLFPIAGLWQDGLQPSGNIFYAEIKKINGAADTYTVNNRYASPFTMPGVVTSSFTIEFLTNNYYYQNNYTIYDENGNVVGASSFSTANTLYSDNYVLSGCYRLKVVDTGGDGLQWWANPNQGSGYVKIKDGQGAVLKSFLSDFGNEFEYNFTTDSPLLTGEQRFEKMVNVYPNPASDKIIFEGDELQGAKMEMRDMLGRLIMKKDFDFSRNTVVLNGLSKGIYFATIKKDNSSFTKKIVVN